MYGKEGFMKEISAYISIGVVCIIVLSIMFFKNKIQYILYYSLRGMVGGVFIYLGNYLFHFLGIDCFVGLNVISVLTCIILGFPGVCALFFIAIF